MSTPTAPTVPTDPLEAPRLLRRLKTRRLPEREQFKIEERLIALWDPLLRAEARKLACGLTREMDDLLQEARMGALVALRDWLKSGTGDDPMPWVRTGAREGVREAAERMTPEPQAVFRARPSALAKREQWEQEHGRRMGPEDVASCAALTAREKDALLPPRITVGSAHIITEEDEMAQDSDPAERLERAEITVAASQYLGIVQSLPDCPQRDAFLLRYKYDLPVEEVARRLGVSRRKAYRLLDEITADLRALTKESLR